MEECCEECNVSKEDMWRSVAKNVMSVRKTCGGVL